MSISFSDYLRFIMQECGLNENPYATPVSYNNSKSQKFKLLSDIVLISKQTLLNSIHNPTCLIEIMSRIHRLYKTIIACNHLESEVHKSNLSRESIESTKFRLFAAYKNSFQIVGRGEEHIHDNSVEGIVDGLKELSIQDIPEYNVYKLQINDIIQLVKQHFDNNDININQIDNSGETLFFKTCKTGDLEKAEMLLLLGCDSNIPSNGMLPFDIACFYGNEMIVSLFVHRKMVDLEVRRKNIQPLNLCIRNGHVKCADILIKAGIFLDTIDKHGETPFFVACKKNDIVTAEKLLFYGCCPNIPNANSKSPLHLACNLGHEELVSMMVKKADLNALHNGKTALHLVIANAVISANRKKLDKIATILIEAGANLDIQDENGKTPFYIACENNKIIIAQKLISHNCNPNIPDIHGNTPLHQACSRGNTKMVSTIITSKRVDINAIYNGDTPLLTALKSEDSHFKKCAEILIINGCDTSIPDSRGWTPLQMASYRGFKDIVLLIATSNNIDLNVKFKGRTALHISIDMKNESSALALIETNANINIQDSVGRTPFYIACEHGLLKVAELLLYRGSDPNIPNAQGYTSLHIACEKGHKDIVTLLVSSGRVHLNARVSGMTAYNIANDFSHTECANLLPKNMPTNLNG